MCSRPKQPFSPESVHKHLEPFQALLGTWQGSGEGHYPTVEPFKYKEETKFGHAGKPIMSYSQATRHPVNGKPMHLETGYIRAPTAESTLELVVADATGLTTVFAGSYSTNGAGLVLEFTSTAVGQSPTAKDVGTVTRKITVSGDTLTYELGMAAVKQPDQNHLVGTLRRAAPLGLTVEQASAREKVKVIDVREESEPAATLKGLDKTPATRIPLGAFLKALGDEAEEAALGLVKGDTLVLCCARGERSQLAAQSARLHGFGAAFTLLDGFAENQ